MNKAELEIRAKIAAGFFHAGMIERTEVFRAEMDLLLLEYSGPLVFKENTDFSDGTM